MDRVAECQAIFRRVSWGEGSPQIASGSQKKGGPLTVMVSVSIGMLAIVILIEIYKCVSQQNLMARSTLLHTKEIVSELW